MMHTRFLGAQDEPETQYDLMKNAIDALLAAASESETEDGGRQVLMEGVSKFVETNP